MASNGSSTDLMSIDQDSQSDRDKICYKDSPLSDDALGFRALCLSNDRDSQPEAAADVQSSKKTRVEPTESQNEAPASQSEPAASTMGSDINSISTGCKTPTSSNQNETDVAFKYSARSLSRAPSVTSMAQSAEGDDDLSDNTIVSKMNSHHTRFSWGLPWSAAKGGKARNGTEVPHEKAPGGASKPPPSLGPLTPTSQQQTPSPQGPLHAEQGTPLSGDGAVRRRHPPTAKLVITLPRHKVQVNVRPDREFYAEIFRKIGFEVFIKGCARRNKLIVGFENTDLANQAFLKQSEIGYKLERYVDVKKTLFPPKASPKTPVYHLALRDLVLRSQRSIKSEQIGIIDQGTKVLVNTVRGRRARLVTLTACGQGTEDLGWVSLKSATAEPSPREGLPPRRIPLLRPLRMAMPMDDEDDFDGMNIATPHSMIATPHGITPRTYETGIPFSTGASFDNATPMQASAQAAPPSHFVFGRNLPV